MEFEINDRIVFSNNNTNTQGVITTIFTNRTPTQYIVQTQNQKFLLNHQQIQQVNDSLSIDFQKILSQLIIQKNEDILISQLYQLLSKITPCQVMLEQNGAKILYTTYQFLIMRKPSIVRNYPFAATNKVIKMLKKMIFAIRKQVLLNHNLISETKQFKQIKQNKINRKFSMFCDDSEKEEQPTAFYENLSCSAFRPYKSDPISQKFEQNQVETKPQQEQIKNIYFKPIILQGPTYQLLC